VLSSLNVMMDQERLKNFSDFISDFSLHLTLISNENFLCNEMKSNKYEKTRQAKKFCEELIYLLSLHKSYI
jgi:hypothetical protein